jgi:Flp pilus assembly protein TadD
VEAEVNALGYEQLRQGRAERAVQLFTLNVRAFPRSANALDSLGEAYERLGRAREARAAYTRALALDPAMASARDGLRRVGQDAN